MASGLLFTAGATSVRAQTTTTPAATTPPSPSPGAATGNAPVSAEDKAAARLAATQGIDLYRAGKYAEALERLNRAEQLFDAPVHLLYIARSQRDLGQWVEAAETYRRLNRSVLASDAPEAFTAAVRDGASELEELEPRIPHVVISVTPSDAPDLRLSLNDQSVSPAAIGLERPQNPGAVHVKATAQGFEQFDQDLTLNESQHLQIDVALKAATPEPTEPIAVADTPPPPPPASKGGVGLLLGLRLAGVTPAGALDGVVVHPGLADSHVRFASMAKGGVELELRLGIHLLDRVAAIVFLSHDAFASKDAHYDANLGSGVAGGVTASPTKPTLDSLGISILGGAPRGKSGPFAELGFAFIHSLNYTTDFRPTASLLKDAECAGTVRTDGLSTRLSLGWNIPMRERFFNLTPYFNWNLGGASQVQYSPNSSCPNYLNEKRFSIDKGPLHSVIGLGIGGDFIIGG
jgi:hypothetical protein